VRAGLNMSTGTVTVEPAPGQAIVALAVAIVPGAAIAFGICAAAGIDDLENEGFAVYLGVVTVLTVLLWLGCRVRFTPDELVVRRMWHRRRIPWPAVASCEFFTESGPAGESNDGGALEWLSVRLRDGRRVGLLPILGGLSDHGAASTPLGRRTERLVATALAELHARGVTSGGVSLADLPAVRALWARTRRTLL
jgi:hypothetical protein